MKKSIIALLIITSLFSCKKKDTNPEPDNLYCIKTEVPIIDSTGKETVTKGIIVGTKDVLTKMTTAPSTEKQGMILSTLSATNHVFGPATHLLTMKEECDRQIYEYKLTHWGQWQAEANANCKAIQHMVNCDYPYYHWSTPQTFTVHPTFAACGGGVLHAVEMVKFPFNVGGGNGDFNYDSDAVASFIEKL